MVNWIISLSEFIFCVWSVGAIFHHWIFFQYFFTSYIFHQHSRAYIFPIGKATLIKCNIKEIDTVAGFFVTNGNTIKGWILAFLCDIKKAEQIITEVRHHGGKTGLIVKRATQFQGRDAQIFLQNEGFTRQLWEACRHPFKMVQNRKMSGIVGSMSPVITLAEREREGTVYM